MKDGQDRGFRSMLNFAACPAILSALWALQSRSELTLGEINTFRGQQYVSRDMENTYAVYRVSASNGTDKHSHYESPRARDTLDQMVLFP